MKDTLTWIRHHWQGLLFLLAMIFTGFLAGIAFTVSEIDTNVADYIEANGCPVKGEDW